MSAKISLKGGNLGPWTLQQLWKKLCNNFAKNSENDDLEKKFYEICLVFRK